MICKPGIVRLLCCLALFACGFVLADELIPDSALCGFEGDCDSVRRSPFGAPLGVPLSWVGPLGFFGLLGLSLSGNPTNRRLFRLGAMLGGFAGASLLAVQAFVLERFCVFCLGIDLIAVTIAVVAWCPGFSFPRTGLLARAVWAMVAIISILLPLPIGLLSRPPEAPAPVRALWVAGKVNIVELTDFDCEHCRRAEKAVRDTIDRFDAVYFVRLVAPMPRHADARTAGKAFVAATAQNKGEAMARLLFEAPERSAATCRHLAERLGLDLTEYDRAVADPRLDPEFDATLLWARKAGPGLPMIWVNRRLLKGTPTSEELEHAIAAEHRRLEASRTK